MQAMNEGVGAMRLGPAVAEEVRVMLARRRISAVQLAKLMEVSQPYLSRRLNGAVAFDLDDLERITRALDIDLMELLPKVERSGGGTPNSRSTQVIRPVSPVAGYGPFGQKPGGSTRPGSPKRRPVLIGPGRRAM